MLGPLKPRILCIDDEPQIGDLLRSLFERTGEFVVEFECDAYAAVNRAKMCKPDLIFVDIKMPGQDGFAITEQIRHEAWLRHRPIIVYSGVPGQEASSVRAGGGGPTVFLQKSAPLSVVEETVRSALAERLRQYQEAVRKTTNSLVPAE